MELFIPMDELDQYAEDTAAALSVSGMVSGRREAAALRGCVRSLTAAEARPAAPGGAQRWLHDNLYLARQAAADVIPAFRAAGRLRAAGGRALVVRVCQALLSSGDGDVDEQRIEAFLLAFQTHLPLASRELGLFGAALRLVLTERLAELYASPEPEERRAGVLFTSLRRLSALELNAVMERVDPVDRLLRQDPADVYGQMDEASRCDYRRRVAKLAAETHLSEAAAAEKALSLAAAGAAPRTRHVGFYLFDRPLGRRVRKPSGLGYVLINAIVPALLSAALGFAMGSAWAGILVWLPLSELVKRCADRLILAVNRPRRLPRLELRDGVPAEGKTLCVISVLLTGEAAADRAARHLEEFRMGEQKCGENLLFGLMCDLSESREVLTLADRALLEHAAHTVEALNERYGGGFFLFTRDRIWNRADKRFIPWERKRGATLELCRFLVGEATGMKLSAGDISELRSTRYLLTLDSDTRLEPGSARALIGTALHPLQRPITDLERGLVVRGHAILQPRIAVGLPDASRTDFARLFSVQGGGDPYGASAGEVYMDRYQSGGFAGKGLIHIQAYLDCMGGRIPEGRVLSHDALEGAFLRGGYVNDVELTDGFPAAPLGYFARAHRWIRGDWQNLRWLFRPGRELPLIERWRLFDSLRRSLLPPALLLGLGAWLFSPSLPLYVAAGVAALVIVFPLDAGRGRLRVRANILHGFTGAMQRRFARLLILPYEAWISLSAIGCALWRMGVTGRRLLEWQTAEQAEAAGRGGVLVHYRQMWFSVMYGALLLAASPRIMGLAAGIVWLGAPALAAALGQPKRTRAALDEASRDWLRRRAAEMWRYYHQFCTAETNYLPPDNVQDMPPAPNADRVSPTNLGLTLLGALCANKLGLSDREETVSLARHILTTAERMAKWRGHLYNWYDTRSLRPLEPKYVSTVDSGNLAACLIAAAAALTELGEDALALRARSLYRAMEFPALYDQTRRLFVIGRAPEEDAAPDSWYDLLESEERLTGYISIASGQVERRHWRQLGRAQVGYDGYRGMVSWSGTMFEYLMPELFLPLYNTSHLGESARFAVYVQRRHTAGPDRLWGVSESAFAALDSTGHYRYKAHGVSALSLERRQEREVVIAPYASYLALAVSPRAAVRNLRKMEKPEYMGPYGFWEAVDFTPGRGGAEGMAVRCVMAHHLGMSLAAVTNTLCDNAVQRWFLTDPAMAAFTGLLQEKIPLDGALLRVRRKENAPQRGGALAPEPRQGEGVDYLHPQVTALSNGAYHLLLSEDGASRASCGELIPYAPHRFFPDRSHGVEIFLGSNGERLSLLPEPGTSARFSWELGADQAVFRAERGALHWSVAAGTALSLPGEWREITLSRGENAPAAELYLGFAPVLIGRKDYAAHPSFARLGIFTRSEDGALLIRRLARGTQREQYLALCADREADYSSDFRQFPTRGGDGAFRPNEGWQCESFLTARVFLPAGESVSRVKFCLCLAGDGQSAKNGARAMLREAAAPGVFLAAARLGMDSRECGEALELVGLLTNPYLPAGAAALRACPREALWKNRISGDRPIYAVECAGEQSVPAALVHLRRFALLRSRGVPYDLVFLTADEGDYRRACRAAIEEAMTKLGLDASSNVYFASLSEDGEALRSAAAVWAGSGGMERPARQTERGFRLPALPRAAQKETSYSFDDDNAFTFSTEGAMPPRCWALPMCGGDLGWMATDAGTGALWYRNARECPLLPWQGDPLSVQGPELLWAEINGKAVSFFAAGDTHEQVTFRFGEAVWEKTVEGVTLRLTAFLPPEKSVRVFRLESSERVRVHWCAPLQIAAEPEDSVCCYVNYNGGVLRAQNPRCALENVTLTARCSAPWEEIATDAAAFAFGQSVSSPRSANSAFCGSFTLEGEAVLLCGTEDAPELLEPAAALASQEDTHRWWQGKVCRLTLEGVSDAMTPLLNGWSAYQALACRVMGRSSVYQSGGAVGFRDQLQDYVNLLWIDAAACRAHILACCAHQFTEGDVQHWWHPGDNATDKGVRTRCSDDLVWLPWAVCEYTETTGDLSLCAETALYLAAAPLSPEEDSRYERPSVSEETQSVLDHCRRALTLVLDRSVGAHHLLLMGSGDWNDGFDRMGPGSESVWLSWFMSAVCHRFAQLLGRLGEPDAERYEQAARALGEAADDAWDGDHYLRGYYGDGSPLGASSARSCRVDSVAQSFAAFCPYADTTRVQTALDTALRTLRDEKHHRTALYTPPFPPEGRAPGYVATYGPGFRENGGQYTHAAVWLARALFAAGRWRDGAAILEDVALAVWEKEYGAEPVAIPADIYTAPGKEGRAGWTWYTGAAGWWYRTAWENMLGFRLKDGTPSFDPPEGVVKDGRRLRYRPEKGEEIRFSAD